MEDPGPAREGLDAWSQRGLMTERAAQETTGRQRRRCCIAGSEWQPQPAPPVLLQPAEPIRTLPQPTGADILAADGASINMDSPKRIPMTSNTQQLKLLALLVAAGVALGRPGSAAEAASGVSGPSAETLGLVHGACAQTLTNIHADLLQLVRTFPVLDGISNAHIVSAEPLIWRNTTWEHHRLSYHKNVRTEQFKPGPGGAVAQQNQVQFVEKGGLRLEIYLVQRVVKIQRAHEYRSALRKRRQSVEAALQFGSESAGCCA